MQKNVDDDELEKQRLDRQLDKELEETFPPATLKVTQRRAHGPKKKPRRSERPA